MIEHIAKNIKNTKDAIKKRFSSTYDLLSDSKVQQELDNRIEEFENSLESHIKDNNPFDGAYRTYRKSYNDFKYNGADEQSILEDMKHYQSIDSNMDTTFLRINWKILKTSVLLRILKLRVRNYLKKTLKSRS